MDIVDIILGSALTPQGEIESYAARAEKAVRDAAQAVSNIETITEQTNANNQAAEEALEQVQNALEELNTVGNLQDIADTEIGKLALSLTDNNQNNFISKNLFIQYPNSSSQLVGICTKYYNIIGQNTDGTMTQKAITDAINEVKTMANINLGAQNVNKIVIVGGNGQLIPGNITEQQLANGEIHVEPSEPDAPTFTNDIVGLNIQYTSTKTVSYINSNNQASGLDFNKYTMYGGRMRCLVDNSGAIQAFYGDSNYTDNPANGYQVMVYQPKFYYKRTANNINQYNQIPCIESQTIQISATQEPGFIIHPLFIDDNGNELEYVLLSAYEGSIEIEDNVSYKDIEYGDDFLIKGKLSSVSGAQPISGEKNILNVTTAEALANNRGAGWHILNSKALSAEQILEMIEFGALNLQNTFSNGICDNQLKNAYQNCSASTGATKLLGNTTGVASQTYYAHPSNIYQFGEKLNSISYRGYENPWGNIWQLIGDVLIDDISKVEHIVYLCNDYNYSTTINDNYSRVGRILAPSAGWISCFSYSAEHNQLFLPGNVGDNSLGLIGDYYYASPYSSGNRCLVHGGYWGSDINNGLFYYACDKSSQGSAGYNVNARLMYIPTRGSSTYINNVIKWNVAIGG